MKKYLTSIILSIIFITITSKLSPIYPVNDWCDTNSFFTMGKALMNGINIYKDLFEQKGPLLYLIYGIGYLISHKSFFGVYLMEILSFAIFIKITYDILDIIDTKNKKYILFILPFIITTSIAFYGGGSAEEFCLPFIAYNFKLTIKYLKNINITNKECIINGVCAACVILIKFNIASFWFGLIILLSISKQFKKTIYFLIGTSIPFVIALIYFNKNIYYFIDVYFIKNIFEYNTTKINIMTIIDNMIDGFMRLFVIQFKDNVLIIITMILSYIHMYKQKLLKRYLLIIIFPFIFICAQEHWYEYYKLPFCIFSIIGLIQIFNKIEFNKIDILTYTLILIILTFIFGKNTYMLKYEKENYVQYKFAKIINNYDDKTILNYGLIDTGFYLATDTIPNVRFFHTMNFSDFKEMYQSQEKYIKEKTTNFIICISAKNDFKNQNEILKKNYKLLDIQRHNDDYGIYYALYVRRDEDDKKDS